MNTKWISTLGSQNFFVSLVTLVLLMFELNGLGTGADPGEVVDAIGSGDVGRIVSIFFLNFLNPLLKLLQKTASWSWSFLKSANFWTQVVTVVLVGLTILGISFPEGAAANIVDAIFGGEFQSIAIALVVNFINPLYHFFFDRKEQNALQ